MAQVIWIGMALGFLVGCFCTVVVFALFAAERIEEVRIQRERDEREHHKNKGR